MNRIVFIGHGRSPLWRELIPLIRRSGFEHDEFNASPAAGLTAAQRLGKLLERARYALLVFTAEDEHEDGTLHPRDNVIHEAGLFQGRLGFERAVMLIEEGCTTFSNVSGLQVIEFTKGDIHSASTRLRRLLEHWASSDDFAEQSLTLAPRVPAKSQRVPGSRLMLALALPALFVPVFMLLQRLISGGFKARWSYAVALALCIPIYAASRWMWARGSEMLKARDIRRRYSRGERTFTERHLPRADLGRTCLAGADFSKSTLYKAALTALDLTECQLRDVDLREAQLGGVGAERADFTGATLNGAYLREANLCAAVLDAADLIEANLNKAQLQRATLQGANLRGATLYQATLKNSDLKRAILRNAVLSEADLSGANLRYADLRQADLRRADLRGADLTGADTEDCQLERARFDELPQAPVADVI